MRNRAVFFKILALAYLPGYNAQEVQCVTVSGGCERGSNSQPGVESAIARFQDGMIYGGSDPIVMSSASNGDSLAMITYLCNDGSAPPRLEGSVIRSSFQKILSCPNRCGGVASSVNANCGFGVLIADNAVGVDCFSKAANVVPSGSAPQIVPSVGAYRNPVCLFDAPGSRVLTGGSTEDASVTGMTVEKCIARAAANGWRYAGVEFGGECFWGDSQANPEKSNQADCNTLCAGNPGQVCGGGNRILVYENSNLQDVAQAKISVDNYNKDPTNSNLAQAAKDSIDNALDRAWDFFNQIVDSFVKSAQQQLIQDLTAASSSAATAVTAATVAIAAVLADQIAQAVASEQAVQNAKNQKPTATVSQPVSTITTAPTRPSSTTTTASSSSTSSVCPMCVSCGDNESPETGPDDSGTIEYDDPELEARLAIHDNNSTEKRSWLEKRVRTAVKEISVCSKSYLSGRYTPANAGNVFPAYGYQYSNPTTTCVWRFSQLVWKPANGGSPARTQGGSYETEHVYEAQLVRQFAEFIDKKDAKTCQTAGLIKNILARETNFPGRGTNPFKSRGLSALGQMMLNLPDNSKAGSLVALDSNLNSLKSAVFNGATGEFSSSSVVKGKLAKVTRFAMLLAYMAEPEVTAIFKATSQRMRDTLRLLDQEIAASTMTGPGFQFEAVYSAWEDDFLFTQGSLVELEMDAMIKSTIKQLKADTTLGSQAVRDMYVTQVETLTANQAIADPNKWIYFDDLLSP